MDDTCPFVGENMCTIYPARPSSCRLYPLFRIKVKEDEEYYYILKEDHRKGFKEDEEWTIDEWFEDQGARIYNEMNDIFMEIILARNRYSEKS